MICMECGGEMMYSTDPLTEAYKGEEITVEGLEYHICRECGEVLMSMEMADKQAHELAKEYSRLHSILSPDEIKELRTNLGLTQKQFERLLGVSSPTVCRWERGSVQQGLVANNLMRVLKYFSGVAEYLMGEHSQCTEIKTNTSSFSIVSGGKRDPYRSGERTQLELMEG